MAIYVKSVREFFSKFFNRVEIEEDKASKLETYLSIIYKILIWDDPFLSGVALSVAHVLFWAVIYFELRLYGIFFISLSILFGLDAAFDGIVIQTDGSHPLKNIRESIKFCSVFLYYLTALRREHPGTFCICMCTGFLILSLIGRTLSGLCLSYFGLISLLLIPGIIYRLPPDVLDAIKHTLHVISTDDGVVHEHDLLPSQEGLLEKDEDGDSMKTDHTADSCTNSFISGVTSMPSYLEAEGSLDGLDEEDLEFAKNIPEVNPSNYSSDSSDNEHKDMKFEVSHFNRDSSSDEEHNYEQGLAFSEIDAADQTHSQPAISFSQQFSVDLLSNLGSMGSSLVSTVLKTAGSSVSPPAKITKRSDSDSDFEIIDSDDIKSEET